MPYHDLLLKTPIPPALAKPGQFNYTTLLASDVRMRFGEVDLNLAKLSWRRHVSAKTSISLAVARLTLLFAFCGLAACGPTEDPLLRSTIDGLVRQVDSLENRLSALELQLAVDSTAYLTPGSGGYQLVVSDLGKLAVNLEDVQPYANGSRVRLKIGNLTNATIIGAKTKLEWGSVDARGFPVDSTSRSREVKFDRSLRPGWWTIITVALDAVPPSQLGYLRVGNILHERIGLLR